MENGVLLRVFTVHGVGFFRLRGPVHFARWLAPLKMTLLLDSGPCGVISITHMCDWDQ